MSVARIRRIIGDVAPDAENQQLSDDDIAELLSDNDEDVTLAAYEALCGLAASAASKGKIQTIGGTLDFTVQAAEYRRLAEKLLMNASGVR